MGKAEREVVKEAEIITCKLINGEQLTTEEKAHPFLSTCENLAKKIQSDFPNVVEAKHIGNSYDTLGDIELELSDENNKFLELKFLNAQSGVGTLANISQDALTEYDVFDALPYSQFLENKDHFSWVGELLDEYGSYPSLKSKVDSKSIIYEKAGFLKKKLMSGASQNAATAIRKVRADKSVDEGKLKIASIIHSIMDRDKKERLEYIEILKGSSLDVENLRKFSVALLTGNHTADQISQFMRISLDELEEAIEANQYEVYYAYKDVGGVVREKQEYLTDLINAEFGVDFVESNTSLTIYFKQENKKMDLLRVSIHWKNKFQGIQTPCLNIFKV